MTDGAGPAACKVLIVDDQAAIAGLLAFLLNREFPGFEVLGECTSAQEALRLSASAKPDLLIMDACCRKPPLGFIRELKAIAPQVRILVLSRWDLPDFARAFLEAGVHGFVYKREPLKVLHGAICMVGMGGSYFSPGVELLRQPAAARIGAGRLTERERFALCLIAEGHSTKEMATVLNVSVKTAEKYRERIMSKLGLHDAVQVTRFAIRHGLVAP